MPYNSVILCRLVANFPKLSENILISIPVSHPPYTWQHISMLAPIARHQLIYYVVRRMADPIECRAFLLRASSAFLQQPARHQHPTQDGDLAVATAHARFPEAL